MPSMTCNKWTRWLVLEGLCGTPKRGGGHLPATCMAHGVLTAPLAHNPALPCLLQVQAHMQARPPAPSAAGRDASSANLPLSWAQSVCRRIHQGKSMAVAMPGWTHVTQHLRITAARTGQVCGSAHLQVARR